MRIPTVAALVLPSFMLFACAAAESEDLEGTDQAFTGQADAGKSATPCDDRTTEKACAKGGACEWITRPDQGDGIGSLCIAKGCDELTTEDACSFNTTCEWLVRPDQGDGIGSVCLEKSAPACADLETADACEAQAACEWLVRPDQGDGISSICTGK